MKDSTAPIASLHSGSNKGPNGIAVVDDLTAQKKIANNILNDSLTGGNLAMANQIKGVQSKDNLHNSLSYAQNTQKQICTGPYPGLSLSQHGGKRKRTRKRKRKRKHTRKHTRKCKCRGKCKCRKTRRRRKSYKKKRK